MYIKRGNMQLTYNQDEAKEFLQNAIEFFEIQNPTQIFSTTGIDSICQKIEKKLRRVSVFSLSKRKKEFVNKKLDAYKAIYYLLKSYDISNLKIDLNEVRRLAADLDIKNYLKEINTFQPLKQQQIQDYSM